MVCYTFLCHAMIWYDTMWSVCFAIFGIISDALLCYGFVCYNLVWYGRVCWKILSYAMLYYAMLWHCNMHLAVSYHIFFIKKKCFSLLLSKSLPKLFFPFVRRQRLPSTNLKGKSSDEGNLVAVWASHGVAASHWVTAWVGRVVPPAIGLRGVTWKNSGVRRSYLELAELAPR